MKSLKRKIAKSVEKISKGMAMSACGSASVWGAYQAKEPKNIFKK